MTRSGVGPGGAGHNEGMAVPLLPRLTRAYRRTGADLPGGDPRPTHGAEMEGWFWRFTDRPTGRVVLALCGVNRHPDGAWATVGLAAHPGGLVESAAVDGATASADRFEVRAGEVLTADDRRLVVRLEDHELDVVIDDAVTWPLRLGAGGVFSAVPFLGQYWHPHVLGGRATGTLRSRGDTWRLDGADVYAEKNWGAGFPDHWWWGQAQGFDDRDVCVAFGGGRLRAGPVALHVGGCVVRLGHRVLRFAPPTALVQATVADGRWRVVARRPAVRVERAGDGAGTVPHVLPVPVPAERRNTDTDFEHLAGRLHLRVEAGGRVLFDGTSHLAALELGSTDAALARSQHEALLAAAGRQR